MKRKLILKYGTFLIACLLLVLGCKKEQLDYRDKYLGTWNFKVERFEVNTDSIGYYYHDTVYFKGEIYYGNLEKEIFIKYTANDAIGLNVGEDGVLSKFPTNYCKGEFSTKDSLNLYLKWGGLGGGTTHQIHGKKL